MREPREPDWGVLRFIQGHNHLIPWDELVALWFRVQNYEAVETIVDIAIREHMPIWGAEEKFMKAMKDR